jgi:Holliday junction DNA helicase RuvA
LAILSHLSIEIIFQAVRDEKPQIFSQVPGIGLKTAQKLILFLHDTIKDEQIMAQITTKAGDLQTDLLEALTGLGYSVVEAQTAIQSLPKDTPEDLETRLRLALQYFS